MLLALRTEHYVLSLGKKKKSLKHFPLLKKKTTHEVLLYFFYAHDLIDTCVCIHTHTNAFNLAIYRAV